MNALDTIDYLAAEQGSRYQFASRIDQLHTPSLPYIEVAKLMTTGQYALKGHQYENHDNAPRMDFMLRYLANAVFPRVDPHIDLSGFYSIELHDSYSYLEADAPKYKNCLTFAKHRDHHHVVLMPDIFHMGKFGGLLDLKDEIPWDSKWNKVGFYGTTTGDHDPLKNERIAACRWGLQHRDWTDLYITYIAQMKPESIQQAIPNASAFYHTRIQESYHHHYKFLLNIAGNTCCWNRLPMILNSKSLCLNMPCKDMCFYYPLLHAGTHFVGCDTLDDMLVKAKYYTANPKEAQWITQNANHFVDQFLKPDMQVRYMVTLFETMADQKA